MKKFISWLKRPKVTVFLKSGNVVKIREYPYFMNYQDWFFCKNGCNFKNFIKNLDDVEMISVRKWYQLWA